MARQTKQRVYTVVKVWRGMAVAAMTFRTRMAAQTAMRRLRREYNPMEDDLGLFEDTIRPECRDNKPTGPRS